MNIGHRLDFFIHSATYKTKNIIIFLYVRLASNSLVKLV